MHTIILFLLTAICLSKSPYIHTASAEKDAAICNLQSLINQEKEALRNMPPLSLLTLVYSPHERSRTRLKLRNLRFQVNKLKTSCTHT